jgi:hypothetical protein
VEEVERRNPGEMQRPVEVAVAPEEASWALEWREEEAEMSLFLP